MTANLSRKWQNINGHVITRSNSLGELYLDNYTCLTNNTYKTRLTRRTAVFTHEPDKINTNVVLITMGRCHQNKVVHTYEETQE